MHLIFSSISVDGSKGGRECLDLKIIEKILNGDEHSFTFLVEKYRVHIFRSVYPILRNKEDAEDCTQEVFAKVYHSLPNYRKEGFKTWITRIAVNHAIDVKRKNRTKREKLVEEIPSNHIISLANDTEKLIISNELKAHIRKKIGELPTNYRDIIYGFYIEEKTYAQLAKEQNVRIKTIETKLYRARQWMRKAWKEEDFL